VESLEPKKETTDGNGFVENPLIPENPNNIKKKCLIE
jgi:hypothetical protein